MPRGAADTASIPEAQELRVRILRQTLKVPESNRLVANESPPRLSSTPVCRRHLARHGRMGHLETEHEQLAVDPRRTPRKVCREPSGRSIRGLREKPWDARPASDHAIHISGTWTRHYGASAQPSPAARSLGPAASVATTTTARSKTAGPNRESTADEFRHASTRQSDGVARSLPTPGPCGFAVGGSG
jgi:hypothetical protein